jgi:hypothetical protein
VALNPSAVPGTIINFSPFIWADRLLEHEVRNHARNPRVSVTCYEDRSLVGPLPCLNGPILSGASWHAAQRPGHVDRHAPVGCLGGGSRFGRVRTSSYGLGLPTRLLGVGSPGCYRSVRWLTFRCCLMPAAVRCQLSGSARWVGRFASSGQKTRPSFFP